MKLKPNVLGSEINAFDLRGLKLRFLCSSSMKNIRSKFFQLFLVLFLALPFLCSSREITEGNTQAMTLDLKF